MANGYYVTANNSSNVPPLGKAVFGYYNEDNSDALFEVGNGSSTTHANAFEVKQNGDIIAKTSLTIGDTKITEAQLQQLLASLN